MNSFPLTRQKTQTIAVIGENATRMMTIGGGSSELKAKKEVSPLEGIRKKFKNAKILHTMGYASGPPLYARTEPSPYNADSLKTKAIEIVKEADLVLFIGGLNKNHHQDCEGGDRLSYNLPFGQDDLLKEIISVNKNVGVVLISGNAVAMPWVEDIKGLMQAWYLGSQAGNVLTDIISGDLNPSGKLPFTFPKKLTDNSAHYYGEISYPGDSINQEYKEDILVGYRWHDTKAIEPMFPFGFGLSYTDFSLSKIETDKKSYTASDKLTVNFTVTNEGGLEGADVVQVYVGKPNSIVERAMKELKGFQKVFLKKGESRQISIDLNINALSYYDENSSDWVLEKGDYYVYVGNSLDNISRRIKIKVD